MAELEPDAPEDEPVTSGTGAPRRFPEPENADAGPLGGGTYSSLRRLATRSSTGSPDRTFRMWGGARLVPHHTSMPIKCVIERKTYVDVPGVYLVENLGIARVIVAHQFTVLNTEAIAPEGKMADRWVILCE